MSVLKCVWKKNLAQINDQVVLVCNNRERVEKVGIDEQLDDQERDRS